MKNKNIGYVSITNEGNVSFSFSDFYIELFGSKQLKVIKSVKEYDKSIGYIVIDTNYGEEFYCLEETIEDMGLSELININEKLENINSFFVV